MNMNRLFRETLVTLAALGICAPQIAFTAEPTQGSAVLDIALRDGGVLQGQVVGPQGSGLAGVPVSIKADGRDVVATSTTSDGSFAVQGLRGGVYQLAAGSTNGVYRFWSAGTAPPVAQQDAIVHVQGPNTGGSTPFILSPWVIGLGIAAAIAVPVALTMGNNHAS